MSNEHKAALAEGREQGRESAATSKRSRPTSPVAVASARRIRSRSGSTPSNPRSQADPLKRVHLVQERVDLDALDASESKVDIDQLEKDFVKSAAPYSERKGITYTAWRRSACRRRAREGRDQPQGLNSVRAAGGHRSPSAGGRRPGPGPQAASAPAVTSSDRSRGTPSVGAQQDVGGPLGVGISPTTLRPAEQTPAMSSTEPLGLST